MIKQHKNKIIISFIFLTIISYLYFAKNYKDIAIVGKTKKMVSPEIEEKVADEVLNKRVKLLGHMNDRKTSSNVINPTKINKDKKILDDYEKMDIGLDTLLLVKDIFGTHEKLDNLEHIATLSGFNFYYSTEDNNVFFDSNISKYGVWTGEIILNSTLTDTLRKIINEFNGEIVDGEIGRSVIIRNIRDIDLKLFFKKINSFDSSSDPRLDIKFQRLKRV